MTVVKLKLIRVNFCALNHRLIKVLNVKIPSVKSAHKLNWVNEPNQRCVKLAFLKAMIAGFKLKKIYFKKVCLILTRYSPSMFVLWFYTCESGFSKFDSYQEKKRSTSLKSTKQRVLCLWFFTILLGEHLCIECWWVIVTAREKSFWSSGKAKRVHVITDYTKKQVWWVNRKPPYAIFADLTSKEPAYLSGYRAPYYHRYLEVYIWKNWKLSYLSLSASSTNSSNFLAVSWNSSTALSRKSAEIKQINKFYLFKILPILRITSKVSKPISVESRTDLSKYYHDNLI